MPACVIFPPVNNSQPPSVNGAGYEMVHVAVDDATSLSYVEVLAGREGATTEGFLSRVVAWFNGQGIECRRVLSDSGSTYKSHGRRKAAQATGLKVKKTSPYTPRTTGKAERFIKPKASAKQ